MPPKANNADAKTPAKTPARTPVLNRGDSSAGKNQSSILGFFSKTPTNGLAVLKKENSKPEDSTSTLNEVSSSKTNATPKPPQSRGKSFAAKIADDATPLPSSDLPDLRSSQEENRAAEPQSEANTVPYSSPSRRTKAKAISYAEPSDDDDDEPLASASTRKIRRKIVDSDDSDDDAFAPLPGMDGAADDDDDVSMDEFVVDDDPDGASGTKKRKRHAAPALSRKRSNMPTPPARASKPPSDVEEDYEMGEHSTAQQWKYDPEASQPAQRKSAPVQKKSTPAVSAAKRQAHKSEPEARYSWLANLQDIDRNPVGHPDYDPCTVYIPPMAWTKFSPFEKQYWEIKQKWFNTVVFFKKGKFYELYEHDATIGHQLFNLKLTDRVNMRMVGVPEASLDQWANQFVAKGYKIARVDQMESALGKEMREREDTGGKNKPKVINRELACVLTKGTLVEGSMLEDDNATYCVAIKETMVDDLPVFGIAFVDTATGQFFLSEFTDDVDLTKFETFIAQTRPQELLLEKSQISVKAMRIMKNNTSPTTIWNYLKASKEFWTADQTRRELECNGYFITSEESSDDVWPEALARATGQDTVISAFGALVQYLRTLKIERDLLSQGNFQWYNPIQKNTTLVLDGQTLINLEIFNNTYDGASEGSLFTLLNRCITPFGKRMFRQWVCHPLADADKINERLDAVDTLNADHGIREQFSEQMTKMPDLERLISRIHAGSCRPDDFVRVLEGFEQIEYTMSLLKAFSGGEGTIDRLIKGMPDLLPPLEYWKTSFNRKRARGEKLLIPERGIEEDFDDSQDRIESIEVALNQLRDAWVKKLKCRVVFKDIGKEIYQLEVPKSTQVPKDWSMMSSTAKEKRYYTPELKSLIRELQEAQETHGQIVKATASRFFKRFDQNYSTWLAAVKTIAHLDCLISLARGSSSLGSPSCRPVFLDQERSVLEFEELRHPCVLPNVTDFIPNTISLGGAQPNLSLLTGANAAGKSTILRMSCVAVIMAQIGCHVPCTSARLTPVDRIMSRLGANDNIFAAQSTFFVELSETKKILSEATNRSLVILDELGRGTSSYDGVAVAQAVLHHVASHIGCVGFFATHYHSLASEFAGHPEIKPRRMAIHVDQEEKRVTFLYQLEDGVAEGSFGMHCASMCGIPRGVIERAEEAAKEWEHTSRLKESLEMARKETYVPLGFQSDVSWMLKKSLGEEGVDERGMDVLMKAISSM